jgi:hypothetical protein
VKHFDKRKKYKYIFLIWDHFICHWRMTFFPLSTDEQFVIHVRFQVLWLWRCVFWNAVQCRVVPVKAQQCLDYSYPCMCCPLFRLITGLLGSLRYCPQPLTVMSVQLFQNMTQWCIIMFAADFYFIISFYTQKVKFLDHLSFSIIRATSPWEVTVQCITSQNLVNFSS